MLGRRFSKIQKRKMTVFMRCLAVSFVAWSLFAISSTYDFLQMSRVSYVNLPEARAFHPLQSEMVQVRLRMSGWDVLLKKFNPDTARLEVDLGALKTRNFIAFSNQIGLVNKQFPTNKQAVSVTPDTLYFDFSKQTQKRVPVKPVYSLSYRKQYGIVGEVRTNPAFVTITGPAEDIEEIAFIETDSIKGELVDSDVRTVSYLNRNNKTNLAIYPTFAEILIPIGEMTEKVIELPIRVNNTDSYTSVRTIPGKVKVTLLVSLLDYSKWTARDFVAEADMEDWKHGRATSLPIRLTKVPPYCQVLRIEPQNIDFFVRL